MEISVRIKNQVENGRSIDMSETICETYGEFRQSIIKALKEPETHCLTYYAVPVNNELQLICAMAMDHSHSIVVYSHLVENAKGRKLESISSKFFQMHIYEREINENTGLEFTGHPWMKPVRYPWNRSNPDSTINYYPFYKIQSNELHEVGVGPIHAGVIEPGHFRFTCHGEMVLHLEIQLGWQHRGVEQMYISKPALLQRTILSESIAGDTAVGHCFAFVRLLEGMSGTIVSPELEIERNIALELERIAIHTGDLSALCVDVAYQLGASVFGTLRTPLINFFQEWCGNRFGKGLIRVGGSHYPLKPELKSKLLKMLLAFSKRFEEMANHTFNLTSVLKRFEKIGTVSEYQARQLGTVGMAAKMAGVKRDIRFSHSFGCGWDGFEPVVLLTGDVHARAMIRRKEVSQSVKMIIEWLRFSKHSDCKPVQSVQLKHEQIGVSAIEGWRGEIVHSAVTNSEGEIVFYKVKDPSMHNWKALEISLRNLEISDFPVNNKSYNLSYCGHDL